MSQKHAVEVKTSTTGFNAKESKMSILKANWWKITIAVLIAALVDFILHRLIPPHFVYDTFPPSIFVQQGSLLPVAVIALLIFFGVVATGFAVTQEEMSGRKTMKGWRYGIAFSVLFVVSLLELSLVLGSSWIDELRNAVGDSISLLLLGLLVAWLMGTNSQFTQGRTKSSGTIFILIPLFFLGGRYFGYAMVHVMSAYAEKPEATFVWTIGVGIWLSVMYWLLKDENNDAAPRAHAIRFGILIFGGFWLINELYMLVFLQASIFGDLLVRSLIDISAVTVSIWIAKTLERNATTKSVSVFEERQS